MNTNPILRSHRSRLIYAIIWGKIVIIQALVVWLAAGLPFGYALADSLIFNLLFACCIIPVWYAVYYSRWRERLWYLNLAAHGILAGVVLAVWLGAGYLAARLLFGSDTEYLRFLNISLWWKILEGILLLIVAILVYYLFMYVERLNEKAVNEIRLTELLKDGELNLLKSQINPHFLFNSLNSVNSLIVSRPEQAQKMLVALSDYLRYAVLATNRVYSCIADEMENIARYLSIEQLRFGDKLLYESDIDPACLSAEIPAMLLQPLFENAIKHGVYESLETVRIVVKITTVASYLNIVLNNDFDCENGSPKKGSGTGLQNIRERLRLLYGNEASLQTKSEAGRFTVVLKIPVGNPLTKNLFEP